VPVADVGTRRYAEEMTLPQSAGSSPEGEKDQPRSLRPEADEESTRRPAVARAGGSGPDLGGAGKVVDALKASADQEFNIAERLSAKARQAFALTAGFFIVAQTVAPDVIGNLGRYYLGVVRTRRKTPSATAASRARPSSSLRSDVSTRAASGIRPIEVIDGQDRGAGNTR